MMMMMMMMIVMMMIVMMMMMIVDCVAFSSSSSHSSLLSQTLLLVSPILSSPFSFPGILLSQAHTVPLSTLSNTLIDFCLSVARPDNLEVFSFVLRAQTTTALARPTTKMHQNTIYNTAQLTQWRFVVVGVDLGFECLYIASYRVFVKAVSPPSFFLLPSPVLDAFTAHICPLHTHITYTLTTRNAIVREEA